MSQSMIGGTTVSFLFILLLPLILLLNFVIIKKCEINNHFHFVKQNQILSNLLPKMGIFGWQKLLKKYDFKFEIDD